MPGKFKNIFNNFKDIKYHVIVLYYLQKTTCRIKFDISLFDLNSINILCKDSEILSAT